MGQSELEDECKYCHDCGSEDLAYKEQYACGMHYICRECGKELCFNHQLGLEYEE